MAVRALSSNTASRRVVKDLQIDIPVEQAPPSPASSTKKLRSRVPSAYESVLKLLLALAVFGFILATSDTKSLMSLFSHRNQRPADLIKSAADAKAGGMLQASAGAVPEVTGPQEAREEPASATTFTPAVPGKSLELKDMISGKASEVAQQNHLYQIELNLSKVTEKLREVANLDRSSREYKKVELEYTVWTKARNIHQAKDSATIDDKVEAILSKKAPGSASVWPKLQAAKKDLEEVPERYSQQYDDASLKVQLIQHLYDALKAREPEEPITRAGEDPDQAPPAPPPPAAELDEVRGEEAPRAEAEAAGKEDAGGGDPPEEEPSEDPDDKEDRLAAEKERRMIDAAKWAINQEKGAGKEGKPPFMKGKGFEKMDREKFLSGMPATILARAYDEVSSTEISTLAGTRAEARPAPPAHTPVTAAAPPHGSGAGSSSSSSSKGKVGSGGMSHASSLLDGARAVASHGGGSGGESRKRERSVPAPQPSRASKPSSSGGSSKPSKSSPSTPQPHHSAEELEVMRQEAEARSKLAKLETVRLQAEMAEAEAKAEAEKFMAVRLEMEREEALKRESEEAVRRQREEEERALRREEEERRKAVIREEVQRLQDERENQARKMELLRMKEEMLNPVLSKARTEREELDKHIQGLLTEMATMDAPPPAAAGEASAAASPPARGKGSSGSSSAKGAGGGAPRKGGAAGAKREGAKPREVREVATLDPRALEGKGESSADLRGVPHVRGDGGDPAIGKHKGGNPDWGRAQTYAKLAMQAQ